VGDLLVSDRIDDSRRAAQHLGGCFLVPARDCLATDLIAVRKRERNAAL